MAETKKQTENVRIKIEEEDYKPSPCKYSASHIGTQKRYTQEQIKEVINYIVDDNMVIAAASRKANFSESSAAIYYRRYLIDNNMEDPKSKTGRRCSKNQINKLISYIVNDNITIAAASKKAVMSAPTGVKYYQQYRKDRNLDIPTKKPITQDQIDKLIFYRVIGKMTIKAASKKANLSYSSSQNYYRQYLND